jgi:hypothetical protein
MPFKAVIASGKDNVFVDGNGPYTAGDTVFITDEAMVFMKAGLWTGGTAVFTGAPTAVNTTTTSPYS